MVLTTTFVVHKFFWARIDMRTKYKFLPKSSKNLVL